MSPPSFFKDSLSIPSCLPQNANHNAPFQLDTTTTAPSSSKCPFTIRLLNPSTHLIRENDNYGEYPNIYAKLCRTETPTPPAPIGAGSYKYVLVLSDTGCGTETTNPAFKPDDSTQGPEKWNIHTFLEFTLNPGGKIPYLVMTTHCHYDHILGIGFLPPNCGEKCSHCHAESSTRYPLSRSGAQSASPATTVLSSSHSPTFITPYAHLDAHSLCPSVHLHAPHYTVGIWAGDKQRIVYMYNDEHANLAPIDTGIVVLHTPGHTPDSLSWYDANERCLSVGDSLYERESPDSRNEVGDGRGKRGWGAEPPMPTIFNNESNLPDWWASLKKVIKFVKERNEETDEIEDQEHALDNKTAHVDADDEDDWTLVQPYQFISPRHKQHTQQHPHQPPRPSRRASKPTSKPKPRLTLSAAHVTACVDAALCLAAVQSFMARILRDEVPFKELEQREGGARVGFWDDCLSSSSATRDADGGPDIVSQGTGGADSTEQKGRFSVRSPLWVIEEGRRLIPREEWT